MNSFGEFAHCIIEGDREELRRQRKVRRTGWLVAIGLQTCVLTLLVLVPLFTPAALPRLLSIIEIPMFGPPVVERPVSPQLVHRTSSPIAYSGNASRPSVSTKPGDMGTADTLGDFSPAFATGPSDPTAILGAVGQPMPAPPAALAPHKPIAVGGTVMEALLVRRVDPGYPTIARVARISGPVVLSAIIATDGTVQSVTVVSGNPVLVPAAVTAVREWRYKPTLLNGQAVEVETLITVNFVLN